MSRSALIGQGLSRYAREGLDTPRGAVIDDQGIERTDTEGILRDMVLGECRHESGGFRESISCPPPRLPRQVRLDSSWRSRRQNGRLQRLRVSNSNADQP